MFFTGTLQDGISKALQESKLVVCFVTDTGEESKTWEDEYLTDDAIASSLKDDAVLLRLEAGSQEAGYLAAIFPLPQNPTLVIIKNGELKEYISAGTSREQFVRRVSGAFQAQAQAQAQTAGTIAQAEEAGATSSTAAVPAAAAASQTPGQDTPAPSSHPSSSTHQPQQPSTAAHAAHEGEARRQAARKEREEIEKRRREKGKMKEQQDQQQQDSAKAKQDDIKKKAAQKLAERQRQAREDRARVLKRIEDDKAERKARDEARRAERRAAAATAGDNNDNNDNNNHEVDVTATTPAGAPSPRPRQYDQCAIQVRLFDGSTIRTRLPATATLGADVRTWIGGARTDGQGSKPYTFKVIMTPLPNRTIDAAAGEEDSTLGELGLAPSATLVLAPVGRHSAAGGAAGAGAYPRINAGLNNPVSRLIAAVLAFVGGILGGVVGAITGSGGGRGVTRGDGGGGQASTEMQDRARGQGTGRDDGGSASRRIKGFRGQEDRERDYQLYNGNSVSLRSPARPKSVHGGGASVLNDNHQD